MLYIITPCYNPQNLESISPTIPNGAKWIIFHHKKKLPKGLKASIIKCSHQEQDKNLNYVLDSVGFNDEDKILYHLDNNIIHPSLYDNIYPHLSLDFSIMQWGQIFKDGVIRLPPVSYCIPGSLDVSSFLISWKYNKNVRFKNVDDMFVNYACECHTNGGCLMIQNYISYYRYLG